MKIVIDLQGAQSLGSRHRGIGRYSLSLTKAILEHHSKNHEVIVLLSGAFTEAILEIRAELKGLILDENIKVWYGLKNISYLENADSTKKVYSEILRDEFIKELSPDIVLNTSLVEGLMDDAVITLPDEKNYLVATILYDLIPYIHSKHYLSNEKVKEWYDNRVAELKKSDIILSISNSSRDEGIKYLEIDKDNIVNISSASDSFFQKIEISKEDEINVKQKFKINGDFIMYTGGIDFRKNIENLIIAYSALPLHVRDSHQLTIVCSIQDSDKERLNALAKNNNIPDGQIIFSGYVSDEELLHFYNLCKLFVFPSWHEGFGLPVLEAMHCQKAVIGSNTTSVPEVIGLSDALFDPLDINSIKDKMLEVLSNDDFRHKLEAHSINHSKNFSWQKTAEIAICALQNTHLNKTIIKNQKTKKPLLAFLSPLPPQKSGISDYSFELLPELLNYYEIDLISDEKEIKLPDSLLSCSLNSVKYFKENYHTYDRVLYHIGNSQFHKHMFLLLREYAGTIVLHDFYISNVVAHIEFTQYKLNFLNESLYNSHGYKALYERNNSQNIDDILWKYPINLDILQQANGIIMHSLKSKELFENFYNIKYIKSLETIPLLRTKVTKKDKQSIKKLLNLPPDSFIISSFGTLGRTKLNHKTILAFINSSLVHDEDCYLVFVGEPLNKLYLSELHALSTKFKSKIIFTEWVDQQTYQNYLHISDMSLQLRTLWRGETSAAALDCMNYGIATIVNANGSMAELPKDSVVMIEDDFSDQELIDAMELLRQNHQLRKEIAQNAMECIATKHNPEYCAKLYFDAIEKFYKNETSLQTTIEKLTAADNQADEQTMLQSAVALSYNHQPSISLRQIFLDITVLVQVDAKSGIQRVVKNILNHLLFNPPLGFKIEPVYASHEGYMYARDFTLEFMNCPHILRDDPIQPQNGDIFIGLDLAPQQVKANKNYLDFLRAFGVEVKFVLYDLLPITSPSFFKAQDIKSFQEWLDIVVTYDGAIAISKDVATQLKNYLESRHKEKSEHFEIDFFHLGSDFKKTTPPLEQNNKITFLMVGTMEPRKAHAQVLEAFDMLWAQNIDINLTIAGKQGWLVDDLIKKIKTHPKLDTNLFWFNNSDDKELELLYANSSALIAASHGEGFGLPLIEAAQHKLPIIARDIPIFREVAGTHALYFEDSKEPIALAQTIKNWLALYKQNKHPNSDNMRYLSSQESAKEFTNIIIQDKSKG